MERQKVLHVEILGYLPCCSCANAIYFSDEVERLRQEITDALKALDMPDVLLLVTIVASSTRDGDGCFRRSLRISGTSYREIEMALKALEHLSMPIQHSMIGAVMPSPKAEPA